MISKDDTAKITSREKNSPGYMDSFCDLAGYAAIAGELSEVPDGDSI